MTSQSNLVLIAKLQDMIHDCLKDYVTKDEPVAILDFPDIRNCGDSAIWLGEMAYLKDRYGKRPAYVSRVNDFSPDDLERVMPTGPIFIHGGGNFGDIWPAHQDFRERVLERFPNRQVIQFPQSIHYNSQARLDESARIIGRHKNFVLLVRDEESKEFAHKHFDCVVRLCPDMAFSIGALRLRRPNSPCLECCGRISKKLAMPISRPFPTFRWKTGQPNPPGACAFPRHLARRERSWRSSPRRRGYASSMRPRTTASSAAFGRFRAGARS